MSRLESSSPFFVSSWLYDVGLSGFAFFFFFPFYMLYVILKVDRYKLEALAQNVEDWALLELSEKVSKSQISLIKYILFGRETFGQQN